MRVPSSVERALKLLRAGAAGFHGRTHLGGDVLALGAHPIDFAQEPAAFLVRRDSPV